MPKKSSRKPYCKKRRSINKRTKMKGGSLSVTQKNILNKLKILGKNILDQNKGNIPHTMLDTISDFADIPFSDLSYYVIHVIDNIQKNDNGYIKIHGGSAQDESSDQSISEEGDGEVQENMDWDKIKKVGMGIAACATAIGIALSLGLPAAGAAAAGAGAGAGAGAATATTVAANATAVAANATAVAANATAVAATVPSASELLIIIGLTTVLEEFEAEEERRRQRTQRGLAVDG